MHDNAKRKGSTQNMYLPNALQNLFLIATMLIFQAAVGLKKKKKRWTALICAPRKDLKRTTGSQ